MTLKICFNSFKIWVNRQEGCCREMKLWLFVETHGGASLQRVNTN